MSAGKVTKASKKGARKGLLSSDEICLFPTNKIEATAFAQLVETEHTLEQRKKSEQREEAIGSQLAELVARWGSLSPYFDHLEKIPVSSGVRLEDHPEIPFLRFDRNGVGAVLLSVFKPVIEQIVIAEQQPALRDLERKAEKVCDLLLEALSVSNRLRLEELYRETRAAIERQKQQRKVFHASCPTISHLITQLTTYLWSCCSIRVYYNHADDIYRIVDVILAALLTPTCLVCGNPHEFKDWRRIRKRDILKGHIGTPTTPFLKSNVGVWEAHGRIL